MYSVEEIITKISEVPTEWIYKFFYRQFSKEMFGATGDITQPFDGRIVKVKSIVNRDSNPSLCFFYKNGIYYWKDFSSGVGGNAVKFVAFHQNKTESVAESMIMRLYEEYVNEMGPASHIITETKVTKPEYQIDIFNHNMSTINFWQRFKISDRTVNRFKVRYSPRYTITKGESKFTFNEFSFAYFGNDTIYQLYQPLNLKVKYININTDYLIGSEQLEFKSEFLGIISGLKDIMAITEVGLNCEYVAPSSENTLIPRAKMDYLKSRYKFVFSMLDNDIAGFKAMKRYEREYDIPYVNTNLRQDLAKNNEFFPIDTLRFTYTKLIDKTFNTHG